MTITPSINFVSHFSISDPSSGIPDCGSAIAYGGNFPDGVTAQNQAVLQRRLLPRDGYLWILSAHHQLPAARVSDESVQQAAAGGRPDLRLRQRIPALRCGAPSGWRGGPVLPARIRLRLLIDSLSRSCSDGPLRGPIFFRGRQARAGRIFRRVPATLAYHITLHRRHVNMRISSSRTRTGHRITPLSALPLQTMARSSVVFLPNQYLLLPTRC